MRLHALGRDLRARARVVALVVGDHARCSTCRPCRRRGQWAMSRSFISDLQVAERRARRARAASSAEAIADHLARGFRRRRRRRPGRWCRALDFVADPHAPRARLSRAAGDPHAHLVGLVAAALDSLSPCSASTPIRSKRSSRRRDAGERAAARARCRARARARATRARPGIGDLALADEAVAVADRDLQRAGAGRAARRPRRARGPARSPRRGRCEKSATTSGVR